MNRPATTNSPTIKIVLIMLASAPPMPMLDSSAPRPRPSNAPPSMPFQGLAGLGAAAAGEAPGRAGAADCIAAGDCADCAEPDWLTLCDCLPTEPPLPMRLASALDSPMLTAMTATMTPITIFFISAPC